MESPNTESNAQQVAKAGQEAIQAWLRHNQRGVSRDKGIRPQGFAARNEGAPESTNAADEHYHRIVESQLARFAGEKVDVLRRDHLLKRVLRHAFGIGAYPWPTVGIPAEDLKLMLRGEPEAVGRFWVAELTEIIGFAAALHPFASIETVEDEEPSPEQVVEAIERLRKVG